MRSRLLSILLVAMLATAAVGPAAAATGTPTAAATGPATAQANCSFPTTATDATGTEVTIEEEPEQVIPILGSPAQIVWELGEQEKVVGMSVAPYTAYLNGSANKTNINNEDGTVNVEQVVGLEPDLVIAPNTTPTATVEQLRAANVTVYKSGLDKSIDSIYTQTELIGRLLGACERADTVINQTRENVTAIREAVADEQNPRVLYEFYNFTAGNGTFISEVIETAGGDNIAANAEIEGYMEINEEVVAQRDPEWVVHPSDAPLPTGSPYNATIAYQQNQTLTVNANYMNQPAPRVVIPMRKLARAFHPEAMAEANLSTANATTDTAEPTAETETPIAADGGNATVTPETTAMSDETESETPTMTELTDAVTTVSEATDTPDAVDAAETTDVTRGTDAGDAGTATTESGAGTTSDSGPGFGVAVALVAFLTVALLVRRGG